MNVRHLAARTVGPASPSEVRTRHPTGAEPSGAAFAEVLQQAQQGAAPLKLSAHAAQRIEQRAISMTEPEQETLREAIAHLDAKGAHEALLLRQDAAFVVSIPNRTVVTAMARDELAERAFTGIDSAMLI